ncbi:MAG: hypothetical protein WD876_02810, partial [Candidatus Pacearchaeota archaeon]
MNKDGKKRVFDNILNDIKTVRIQGARNIAKKALYAYSLIPTNTSKKLLLKSRPTEPMMENVLNKMHNESYEKIISHFDKAQGEINKYVFKLIKNGDVIFTHCHSTNVSQALIHAKKHGKKFEIYNTETRPLFQGRKTARELSKAKIKVTMFIDSALENALTGQGKLKKVNKVFIGADALLKDGIINKIGSELVARIAKDEKIKFYVIADSWKFTNKKVPIEQRALNEIWGDAPRNVKIQNPAFEFI